QDVFVITASNPTATQPDPGQPSTSLGQFTITRGGFPLDSVAVGLALASPGPGVAVEGVDHVILSRVANFPAGTSSLTVNLVPLANTNLTAPVVASLILQPGSKYKLGSASAAS